MFDCHMHCEHSHDNNTPIDDMINTAISKGMQYIAFTDHLDRDFLYDNNMAQNERQLDIDRHIAEVLDAKERYRGKIDIALGVECGYSLASEKDYKPLLDGKPFDLILNSIHTIGGIDCYKHEFFDGKDKHTVYCEYLQAVYDSVVCEYDYDVLPHLGYVCRRAPYDNTVMSYDEYSSYIDKILNVILDRGVTLELNTHSRGTGADFLPYADIIDRYIELGGTEFCYGTDAHRVDRVCDKYEIVRDFLKSRNVKYINTFKGRKIIKNLI